MYIHFISKIMGAVSLFSKQLCFGIKKQSSLKRKTAERKISTQDIGGQNSHNNNYVLGMRSNQCIKE